MFLLKGFFRQEDKLSWLVHCNLSDSWKLGPFSCPPRVRSLPRWESWARPGWRHYVNLTIFLQLPYASVLFSPYGGVLSHGGTPEPSSPRTILALKPIVLGYPHFRKPPCLHPVLLFCSRTPCLGWSSSSSWWSIFTLWMVSVQLSKDITNPPIKMDDILQGSLPKKYQPPPETMALKV